jgi:hypothetical protein
MVNMFDVEQPQPNLVDVIEVDAVDETYQVSVLLWNLEESLTAMNC